MKRAAWGPSQLGEVRLDFYQLLLSCWRFLFRCDLVLDRSGDSSSHGWELCCPTPPSRQLLASRPQQSKVWGRCRGQTTVTGSRPDDSTYTQPGCHASTTHESLSSALRQHKLELTSKRESSEWSWQDLSFFSRNWTRVPWMKTRNPSCLTTRA